VKLLLALITLVFIATPAWSAGRKDCEELKSEIDAKVKKNGVKVYTLTIISNEEAKTTKDQIVGSCNGGTAKITYRGG